MSFASATAMRLLIDELDQAAPGYLTSLNERLSSAITHGEMWKEEGDPEGKEFDGFVPVQGPAGRSVTYIPLEDAYLLQDQLFADGASADDQLWLVRGQLVVALHSALDRFAREVGGTGPHLPEAVRQLLRQDPALHKLDGDAFGLLAEFDATRYPFVHNGGTVDDKYQRAVRNSPILTGERRHLDDGLVDSYAHLCWRLGNDLLFHCRESSRGPA